MEAEEDNPSAIRAPTMVPKYKLKRTQRSKANQVNEGIIERVRKSKEKYVNEIRIERERKAEGDKFRAWVEESDRIEALEKKLKQHTAEVEKERKRIRKYGE